MSHMQALRPQIFEEYIAALKAVGRDAELDPRSVFDIASNEGVSTHRPRNTAARSVPLFSASAH